MSKTERPSRRAALLGDRPGSYAIARHVRMSASKCRRVINLVRGMDAVDAVTMLKFQPQAAAEPIRKVIASAMANAEQTEGLLLALDRAESIATLDRLLGQAP